MYINVFFKFFNITLYFTAKFGSNVVIYLVKICKDIVVILICRDAGMYPIQPIFVQFTTIGILAVTGKRLI